MIPSKFFRGWQTKPPLALGPLMCCCLLGHVSPAYCQTEGVNQLINKLNDPDWNVRAYAAQELGSLKDPQAVEPLIVKLKDDFIQVRVAMSLGEIKDPRAVEPLIAALKDNNFLAKGSAVSALGEIGDPRAVEPLIAALKDSDVEIEFELAMKDIGPPAVNPLIAALKSPESRVRIGAIGGLGWIKDHRAVEPLIAALKDPDAGVRKKAANVLSQFNDPRSVEPLMAAINDPDAGVQENVKYALARIDDPRSAKLLNRADPIDAARTAGINALIPLRDHRTLLILAIAWIALLVGAASGQIVGNRRGRRSIEMRWAATFVLCAAGGFCSIALRGLAEQLFPSINGWITTMIGSMTVTGLCAAVLGTPVGFVMGRSYRMYLEWTAAKYRTSEFDNTVLSRVAKGPSQSALALGSAIGLILGSILFSFHLSR
jgi:HEAT repeat protein